MDFTTNKRHSSPPDRARPFGPGLRMAAILALGCAVALLTWLGSGLRPSLSADAIVETWEGAALSPLQSGSGDRVLKWVTPLDAHIPAAFPPRLRDELAGALARSAASAGLGLTVRDEPSSTVRLTFAQAPDQGAASSASKAESRARDLGGVLVRVAINLAHEPGGGSGLSAWASLRALGFQGDVTELPVWSGRGSEVVAASDLLPALHYDPRLRPGMDRAAAKAVVATIAREIMAAPSFLEWRDSREADRDADDVADTLVAAYDRSAFPSLDTSLVTKLTQPVRGHIEKCADRSLEAALRDALRRAAAAGAPLEAKDAPAKPALTCAELTLALENAARTGYDGNAPSLEDRLATHFALRLMGFGGDTDLADVQVPGWGADLVAAMAAIHHDPRITPAMPRSHALPVVRHIAREMAQAGSVSNWLSARANSSSTAP